MLEVISNIIIYSVMPICGFFIISKLLNKSVNFLNIKNLIFVGILIFCNFAIYRMEAKEVVTLLNFCMMVICYRFIFNISLFDSFLSSVFLMIIAGISDILLYVVMTNFFNTNELKNEVSLMIISNVLVGLVSILVSRLRFWRMLLQSLLEKLKKKKNIKVIIFVILWILTLSIVCYIILKSPIDTAGFWASVFIEIVIIIFLVVYLKDKYNYMILNDKFDNLFDCVQTMEEYFDAEKLNIHEYKNQLSVIKSMTKDKKIINYINSLVSDAKYENLWTFDLKELPKGGFKGLLYYKFAIANSKKLNITINISGNSYEFFHKLSNEYTKKLSTIVGIYLDNAIEEAEYSKKKNLCFEIYTTNVLNIVISNSLSTEVNIKNISKKGYSSKGKGRGYGLYFAQKIIEKNPDMQTKRNIINEYYVQRITIKKEK